MVFSFNLFNTELYPTVFVAFFAFCFLSSAVYVFNDLLDLERDKLHPRKQKRALPAGRVTKQQAIMLGFICLMLSATLTWQVNSPPFIYALLAYLGINIAYVLKIKHVAIADCFSIASGFVIRVLAGCYAIQVVPSDWIVVVTFFLALFLAFGKRKSELLMLDTQAGKHRAALNGYNLQTLDVYIYISAAISVTAYLMYTLTSTTLPEKLHQPLKYSAFFVVFGLFRYIQLLNAKSATDADPTVLVYKDRLLQATLVLWIVYAVVVIYG